jgi:hypothetical protein
MPKENLKQPLDLQKDIIAKLDENQLKEIEGGTDGGQVSCHFVSCIDNSLATCDDTQAK